MLLRGLAQRIGHYWIVRRGAVAAATAARHGSMPAVHAVASARQLSSLRRQSNMTAPKVQDRAQVRAPDAEALEDVVSFVLKAAREQGASQAEAVATHDVGLSATARLGDVESLEYTNDRGVGVTVYAGQRKGSASTSDFSESALSEAVAKAWSIASLTEADEYAGLPDAELMARADGDDLSLHHPWDLSAQTAIDLAVQCESSARSFDSRITNSEGATVSTNEGARAYGNSHGFLGSVRKSSHSLSCSVVGEASGEKQRDYWYTTGRNVSELESAEDVGRKAAERTIRRLGARKVSTTTAPVVFAPELARGFIGHAISAIAGGAQYRRASFLLEAAGNTIFPTFFQIQERPFLRGAMASAAYDGEGVATYDRDIVSDGVLREYVLSSYSARRLGLKTTANAGGTQNLIIPGTVENQAAIMKWTRTRVVGYRAYWSGRQRRYRRLLARRRRLLDRERGAGVSRSRSHDRWKPARSLSQNRGGG